MPDVICQLCGTLFYVQSARLRDGRGKYCSKDCHYVAAQQSSLVKRPSTPDLTGQVFGQLTVIEFSGYKSQKAQWICLCECGNATTVYATNLTNKTRNTRSCGCLLKPRGINHPNARHGGFGTAEYRIWAGMIQRCTNPKVAAYPRYGGRGITVCDAWRRSFVAFLTDMGKRPSPSHSIDRLDNNRGYEPSNCAWSLPEQQSRNRRNVNTHISQRVTPIRKYRTIKPYVGLVSMNPTS